MKDNEQKTAYILTKLKSQEIFSDLESVAPQLYNLEPNSKPESVLNIKLNLYQLEREEPPSRKLVKICAHAHI